MKLNILVTFAILSLSSTLSFANEQTDKTWTQQLRGQGILAKDQSYCYTDKDGAVQGSNIDLRIRLASVSKLLTTLWVVEKLGPDYRYNTKLYIKGNDLHIEGSYDPFLGNEKMFYLISQLNDLGYTHFDTITFDKNVIIEPDVQYEMDEYPTINAVTMGRFIKNYFNTKSWSEDSNTEYATFSRLAKEGRFRSAVSFDAQNVKMVDANPFATDENVKVLTLSSPGLYKYLKQMNVKSNNYVAETLFRQMGGTSKFPQFLNDSYKLTKEQINFFSGSGLPTIINGTRFDNYATCGVVINLISKLKSSVEKQNMKLEDVVAVPGSDGGTFRNRIISADLKNSFVAKTGTLMHTSTLAGAMNTQTGFNFFGVFNQSTDIAGSKIVQNAMVKSIMSELGGPKAFNYEVEGFHAYENESLKTFAEDPDFTSIEGDLH